MKNAIVLCKVAFAGIALILAMAALSSCVTTGPTCLSPEKYRFQADYGRRGTAPTCIGKECARYQYRSR